MFSSFLQYKWFNRRIRDIFTVHGRSSNVFKPKYKSYNVSQLSVLCIQWDVLFLLTPPNDFNISFVLSRKIIDFYITVQLIDMRTTRRQFKTVQGHNRVNTFIMWRGILGSYMFDPCTVTEQIQFSVRKLNNNLILHYSTGILK